MDLDTPSFRGAGEQRPPSSQARGWALAPPPALPNFAHVRKNIHKHAAGIFEPPGHHYSSKLSESAEWFPPLPSRAEYTELSRSYVDMVHENYPVLHWPTFQSEVDQVYTMRSFQGKNKVWVGTYFAVLACGCLGMATAVSHAYKGGTELYEIASQAMTPWPQAPSKEHARLLFLLSFFATENGTKSAGSMWLACAARIAQALLLNRLDLAESASEAEMQRRLWWAIYVQDRCVCHFRSRQLLISKG